MTDLGCVNESLALKCHLCDYRPAAKSVVEAFLLHCQVEHATDTVAMDLVAVCRCDSVMLQVRSRPTGGGFKDYVECPDCGNTGYIKRDS